MIARETIEEIKSQADIVDVVSDFVALKRCGTTYKALSPFTNERTASFYVVPSKGIFKDFSSGKGGDAITFLMELEGITYPEALRYLAKKYGIVINEDSDGSDNKNSSLNMHRRREHFAQNQLDPLSATHRCDSPNPSFIPYAFLEQSLDPAHWLSNHFIQYLKKILGANWEEYAKRFYVGSASTWPGSTVFWQIDSHGRIRSGKIVSFNPETGKKIKGRITWVHSRLLKKKILTDFNLRQCLFGEHQLIKDRHKSVSIVESEKTAIVASAYLPETLWMACGSLNNISEDRLLPVAKNNIILYPDLNGYDKWCHKANELRRAGFRIEVSSALETASFVTDFERESGYDLEDYLPRLPLPQTDLDKMIAKHPMVGDLVRRLDLAPR